MPKILFMVVETSVIHKLMGYYIKVVLLSQLTSATLQSTVCHPEYLFTARLVTFLTTDTDLTDLMVTVGDVWSPLTFIFLAPNVCRL